MKKLSIWILLICVTVFAVGCSTSQSNEVSQNHLSDRESLGSTETQDTQETYETQESYETQETLVDHIMGVCNGLFWCRLNSGNSEYYNGLVDKNGALKYKFTSDISEIQYDENYVAKIDDEIPYLLYFNDAGKNLQAIEIELDDESSQEKILSFGGKGYFLERHTLGFDESKYEYDIYSNSGQKLKTYTFSDSDSLGSISNVNYVADNTYFAYWGNFHDFGNWDDNVKANFRMGNNAYWSSSNPFLFLTDFTCWQEYLTHIDYKNMDINTDGHSVVIHLGAYNFATENKQEIVFYHSGGIERVSIPSEYCGLGSCQLIGIAGNIIYFDSMDSSGTTSLYGYNVDTDDFVAYEHVPITLYFSRGITAFGQRGKDERKYTITISPELQVANEPLLGSIFKFDGNFLVLDTEKKLVIYQLDQSGKAMASFDYDEGYSEIDPTNDIVAIDDCIAIYNSNKYTFFSPNGSVAFTEVKTDGAIEINEIIPNKLHS